MYEREDRSGRGGRLPVLAAVIGMIVIAAAGGGYLWYRNAGGLPQQAVPRQGPQEVPGVRPDEPVPLTLFVPAKGMLDPVVISARRQPDVQLAAREALLAVLGGERGGQVAVLKEFRLRGLYLDPAGTAFADLSPAGQKEIRASVGDELLAVYAIVNTLTQNFPEIKQVRLLVDGREAQTLAGHLDLSRSFVKRTDLMKVQ